LHDPDVYEMSGDGDDYQDAWMMSGDDLALKNVFHVEMLMIILIVHALVILSVSACCFDECRDRGSVCYESCSPGAVTFPGPCHDSPF
jgi:hypothetical protein